MMLSSAPVIVWYRNDFRTHDHEPLYRAAQNGRVVVPVYCHDPAIDTATLPSGFIKTGTLRRRFIAQALHDLNHQLSTLGSPLVYRIGSAETVLPQLAAEIGAAAIFFHQLWAYEERQAENRLRKALPKNIQLIGFQGDLLLHPEDLPFSPHQVPALFTEFRKRVEMQVLPRPPYRRPDRLAAPAVLPFSDPLPDPNLDKDGRLIGSYDEKDQNRFRGGESAGLDRLNYYFYQSQLLKTYKVTRNGLLGADYSSKFSPWLAAGCLSPRYIYHQLQLFEHTVVKNESTYWLFFELLWRDYFRLVSLRYGNHIFQEKGLQQLSLPWQKNELQFQVWRTGNTGYPIIDAAMRELLRTGYLSNRARQLVAGFLTKNLGIYWLWGAEWFESQLIDYDVFSNYGNWNYAAGIGNDARGFRYFHIIKQAQTYDPEGHYVKYWCPELTNLPAQRVHTPWLITEKSEQARYRFIPGDSYPLPIVDLDKSVAINQAQYNAAVRNLNKQTGNIRLQEYRKQHQKKRNN